MNKDDKCEEIYEKNEEDEYDEIYIEDEKKNYELRDIYLLKKVKNNFTL